VSSIQKEMLLNFDFIKVFGLESYYGTKHYSAATAALDTGVRRSLRTGPLFGLYQAISLPLSALVFYYGTSIVARGPGVKVDEILQVINLLLFSVGMSFELLNNLPELAAAKEAAAELLWYVQIPEAPPQPGYSENQPCSPLPVRIRNLEFAPDAFSPRILSGFSFDIEPSRSLAMVGASGSGKSTALSLLLGLNVPNSVFANQPKLWSFEMSFGHVPQPIIDMKLLRSKMAYVPQRPFLFPGTIAENIAYGIHPKPAQHLPDSVIEAAKASGIHEFIISLPNGYDTVVGDGGQALSGGQAQLVNIARAMARKPQLLILDEPTSALDVDSAAAVRSAIRCLIQSSYGQKAGMAIVVATHSIEMMKAVDEIVVLHAGTKVEQGTFSVLTAKRGPFWQLVTHSAE
jgi:ATP-binding cassette subfamily B (MDR/TAP) protein 1